MTMPQAIEVRDAEGRWAVYVPLEINGKIVRPQPPEARLTCPQRRAAGAGSVRVGGRFR